jgi:DsbC/DsbD-like thiol-disulfide interchange protein
VLPPENVADSVMLAVRVSWLECRDICRPGSADLSAILLRNQQGASVTVEQTGILQRAEKHFPVKAWQWPGTIKGRNQRVQMTLPANSSLKAPIVSAVFFPYTEMVWDISSDIKISNNRRGQILQIPLDSERQSDPDRIQGIMMLQMQSSEGTFSVNAPIDEPIL